MDVKEIATYGAAVIIISSPVTVPIIRDYVKSRIELEKNQKIKEICDYILPVF